MQKFPCQVFSDNTTPKFKNGYVISTIKDHYSCICDFIAKYANIVDNIIRTGAHKDGLNIKYRVHYFDEAKREYHLNLELIDNTLGYPGGPRRVLIAPQSQIEYHCEIQVAETFMEMANDNN